MTDLLSTGFSFAAVAEGISKAPRSLDRLVYLCDTYKVSDNMSRWLVAAELVRDLTYNVDRRRRIAQNAH